MQTTGRKTYRGMVKSLSDNQVFVFGSNKQGRHGAGAALFAKRECGALYGQPQGIQGRSYAIVTKDLEATRHPSVSREEIESQIRDLYAYAREYPSKEFIVAYSADGRNLSRFSAWEMSGMFACQNPPSNVVFEEGFSELLERHLSGKTK